MPESNEYDADPIREGAVPTLSISGSGLSANVGQQPSYVWITEALVRWLRYHFSAATRIEYPVLINRVWIPDREKSPIQITSLAEFAPNNSNQRPALLVDRLDQDLDLQHRGIADQFMGIRQGNYGGIVLGAHVIHCIGGVEGEAEYLAAEVWRELRRFAPIAREAMCLLRFLPIKIGKRVQLSEEHRQTYTIPVLIQYAWQESWKIRPTDEEEITAIGTILSGI